MAFRKNAASLQENTNAEVQLKVALQKTFFVKTPLRDCF